MVEFRGPKVIQKMTLNAHKRYFTGQGQKKHLKFKKMTPFCITVILSKSRLKNTLSIREITAFWKLDILQSQNGQ